MKRLIFCLGLFALVSPLHAAQIGDFSVDVQKDPFNEADRYVAETEQHDAALFVRCLNGKVGMAFGFFMAGKVGDPVTIKLKVGDGAVDEMPGKVIATETDRIVVQAGNLPIVEKLAGAKSAAVQYEIDKVKAFYTFSLHGIDKIVAAAKAACRVQQRAHSAREIDGVDDYAGGARKPD
jgi:hypothetical protein